MSDFEKILVGVSRLSDGERAELLSYLRRSSEGRCRTDVVEEPRPAYGAAVRLMTPEEFFELRERGSVDYEYVNGVIRAMNGPSVAHCLITQNIFRAVDARLHGGPCQTFSSGCQLKLTPGDDKLVYLPDLLVSCDRSAWNEQWIPNPKFVVEVLSPSTQHIDRREKLLNYRRVPSIEEYVIASQKRAEVEIYSRAENWRRQVFDTFDAIAEFRSVDVRLPLHAIYEGVTFKSRQPCSDL
jgi:Uma2 family endonuclease